MDGEKETMDSMSGDGVRITSGCRGIPLRKIGVEDLLCRNGSGDMKLVVTGGRIRWFRCVDTA